MPAASASESTAPVIDAPEIQASTDCPSSTGFTVEQAAAHYAAAEAIFYQCKDSHPDCLILFRSGDFYELLGSDALTAAQVLNLATISPTAPDDPTVIRFHLLPFRRELLDSYLPRIIRAGHRIAITDAPTHHKTIPRLSASW